MIAFVRDCINLECWFIFLRYSYWKWEFIFPCYLGLLTVKFSLLQIWLWNIYWLLVLRFVHPIFSPFGFWYFDHFSCVIFFPVFFRLAHLALQNVNKDYIIFWYFRNFVAISNQKPKMGWTKHWRVNGL